MKKPTYKGQYFGEGTATIKAPIRKSGGGKEAIVKTGSDLRAGQKKD